MNTLTLPPELVSFIISKLNLQSKLNFKETYPEYSQEVDRLSQPKITNTTINEHLADGTTNTVDYIVHEWHYNGYVEKKIVYSKDNIIMEEKYYNEHGLHRDDDTPAWKSIIGLRKEHWYQNGVLHRLNGPAYIEYHGSMKVEYYAQMGRFIKREHVPIIDPNKIIHIEKNKLYSQTDIAHILYHKTTSRVLMETHYKIN